MFGRSNYKKSFKILMGDVCCAIFCDNHEVYDYLSNICTEFLAATETDVNIEITTVSRPEQIKTSKKGNRYYLSNFTLDWKYEAANHSIYIVAEKALFEPKLGLKFVNWLLPTAYYTACTIKHGKKPPAMIVHGCGIVRHGKALIFTGPSETGKTTVAKMCGYEFGSVLNDEMILVSWPENGHPPLVQGTPILGGVAQKLNEEAPLRCVLLLKQSNETSLQCLGQKDAYLRFFRQVIAPAGLVEKTTKRDLISFITSFSVDLVNNTKFYEMKFNLNKNLFWEAIEDLEEALSGERL